MDIFGILPNSVKIITDIYLILFFVEILLKNKFSEVIKLNKITRFTAIYSAVFTVIFVLSALVNQSNISLSLLEHRKIIFPLLFLLVLNYYSILKNKIYNFEPFLRIIFIVQMIIIPLQYIFYDLYKGYMVTYMNRIDSASGTFGVGTAMVGVFIINYYFR